MEERKLQGSTCIKTMRVWGRLPDALQEYRLKRKMAGLRPTALTQSTDPELLDACDRLGILVIDENRLMGVNPAKQMWQHDP